MLIALFPAAAHGQGGFCNGEERSLGPSRDLYCVELVRAVGVRQGIGRVELGHAPGPFTVNVSADGHLRYTPRFTLRDLPPPSALGAYSAYIAWVASPTMDIVERLGVVGNGQFVLPPIALDKFAILITAETSRSAREMNGRLVLRGMSPSTRLQPPDFMQFVLGATREDSSGRTSSDHEGHMAMATGSTSWSMVPMPPGISMLPAEMALRPDVAPYLPASSANDTLPLAQPRRLVRLASGDTLRLTAGIVRRAFKDHTLTMFAFNGQYPGPLLQVAQGAEVVVELTNALDQPTTVHWHGIRLDNANDGVPDLTQRAVQPGERFTYHLRFPDAGIYWYHPHVREDVQQDLGLAGNLVVRSARADYFSPANRDEVLMLDDLLIDDHGLVPYGSTAATHALMGRFGNVLLVNGEPRYALDVQRGEVVRFFFTNVSNTRTFNLSFPSARMKVVASDVGNYEREEWTESVVIAPAERYVVHVRFDSAGTVPLLNRVRGLDHLYGRFFSDQDTLGNVRVARQPVSPSHAASFTLLRTDTAVVADIDRYRSALKRPVDRTLVLTMETTTLPFFTGQIMQLDSVFFTPVEWSGTMPGMNWAATSNQVRWILRDAATGKENMDIDWTFARGDVVKIRLVNERRSFHGMQHPIHIHGQRFLVLSVNDVPNTNLVWKDTVMLPAGSTTDILLDLSNPGRWMVHCHIAEHLSAGMMMALTVH